MFQNLILLLACHWIGHTSCAKIVNPELPYDTLSASQIEDNAYGIIQTSSELSSLSKTGIVNSVGTSEHGEEVTDTDKGFLPQDATNIDDADNVDNGLLSKTGSVPNEPYVPKSGLPEKADGEKTDLDADKWFMQTEQSYKTLTGASDVQHLPDQFNDDKVGETLNDVDVSNDHTVSINRTKISPDGNYIKDIIPDNVELTHGSRPDSLTGNLDTATDLKKDEDYNALYSTDYLNKKGTDGADQKDADLMDNEKMKNEIANAKDEDFEENEGEELDNHGDEKDSSIHDENKKDEDYYYYDDENENNDQGDNDNADGNNDVNNSYEDEYDGFIDKAADDDNDDVHENVAIAANHNDDGNNNHDNEFDGVEDKAAVDDKNIATADDVKNIADKDDENSKYDDEYDYVEDKAAVDDKNVATADADNDKKLADKDENDIYEDEDEYDEVENNVPDDDKNEEIENKLSAHNDGDNVADDKTYNFDDDYDTDYYGDDDINDKTQIDNEHKSDENDEDNMDELANDVDFWDKFDDDEENFDEDITLVGDKPNTDESKEKDNEGVAKDMFESAHLFDSNIGVLGWGKGNKEDSTSWDNHLEPSQKSVEGDSEHTLLSTYAAIMLISLCLILCVGYFIIHKRHKVQTYFYSMGSQKSSGRHRSYSNEHKNLLDHEYA